MNEARSKAKELMEEAEDYSRVTLEKMEMELNTLAQSYREMQTQKENFLEELSRFLNDTTDRLKRTNERMKNFDVSEYLKKTKVDSFIVQVNKGVNPETNSDTKSASDELEEEDKQEPESKDLLEPKPENSEDDSQSFFDKI